MLDVSKERAMKDIEVERTQQVIRELGADTIRAIYSAGHVLNGGC